MPRISREVSGFPTLQPRLRAASWGESVPAGLGSHVPGLAGVGWGPRGPQQQLQLQPQWRVVPDRALQGGQQALAPLHALREQLHAPGSGRGAQCLHPLSSNQKASLQLLLMPSACNTSSPKVPYQLCEDDVVWDCIHIDS